MDRIPTWPEMARDIVESYLLALDEHEKAVARGDTREAKGWAKEARSYKKMMQKYEITIRYASGPQPAEEARAV